MTDRTSSKLELLRRFGSVLARAALVAASLLPAAFRLALVAAALWFIFRGAEAIYGGAGYLLVGVLVWIDIQRRDAAPPKADEQEVS